MLYVITRHNASNSKTHICEYMRSFSFCLKEERDGRFPVLRISDSWKIRKTLSEY